MYWWTENTMARSVSTSNFRLHDFAQRLVFTREHVLALSRRQSCGREKLSGICQGRTRVMTSRSNNEVSNLLRQRSKVAWVSAIKQEPQPEDSWLSFCLRFTCKKYYYQQTFTLPIKLFHKVRVKMMRKNAKYLNWYFSPFLFFFFFFRNSVWFLILVQQNDTFKESALALGTCNVHLLSRFFPPT